MKNILRSRIIRMVLLFAIVLVIAGAAAFGTRTLRTSCEDLGPRSRFRFGFVVRVPCIPGYVVNAGESRLYLAVTPAGRALEWDPIRRLFHDRAWREVFDAQGEPLKGSGPTLKRCALRLEGGRLRIDRPQACRVGAP